MYLAILKKLMQCAMRYKNLKINASGLKISASSTGEMWLTLEQALTSVLHGLESLQIHSCVLYLQSKHSCTGSLESAHWLLRM